MALPMLLVGVSLAVLRVWFFTGTDAAALFSSVLFVLALTHALLLFVLAAALYHRPPPPGSLPSSGRKRLV
jgi:hypothetical protein